MPKTELVEQNQATNIIQVIEKAAYDPDIDVGKMERLLAMHERITEKQAIQAFDASMIECQKAMPTIEASADNRQTNSKYAKYENINKVIKPVYTEHGFDVSFSMGESTIPNYIRVIGNVSHVGGHSKPFYIDLPPDGSGIKGNTNKTEVHATASTVSYAKRYLVTMIFNLTIGGEDDDANSAGGDSRSAMEIRQEHLDYMALVRDWWPSIAAIKSSLATGEYSIGAEAVSEIPDKERIALWKAPTKGGIFTTEERGIMKTSQEWFDAKQEFYGNMK